MWMLMVRRDAYDACVPPVILARLQPKLDLPSLTILTQAQYWKQGESIDPLHRETDPCCGGVELSGLGQ